MIIPCWTPSLTPPLKPRRSYLEGTGADMDIDHPLSHMSL